MRLEQYMARLRDKLQEPVDAASLAFFRVVFGSIMLLSQVRFLAKGWVELLYVKPTFFFRYYGFHWIPVIHGRAIYLPWIGMIVCLMLIILGKYYRWAMASFFLLFAYTELLDLTNYLNHYYLITLLSFIQIFLPMNACFSLDARSRSPRWTVPRWQLTVLRLQVGMVYFFAGLAKIKYDWLFQAQPLKIWLTGCRNIPWVGRILAWPVTAYFFSWIGMLFDLTAPFFLLNKKTRKYEYGIIVAFHIITLWLFYIGIFPLIMMGIALVFFPPSFHRKILEKYCFWLKGPEKLSVPMTLSTPWRGSFFLWGIYFLWQVLMPLRHLCYPGRVLWTEEGFRYSWNVMLMEKDGYVEFQVQDKVTGERFMEYPQKHLTALQGKMMSTQPDMMLQYAHFLADLYREKTHHPVAVYADTYVSLNQHGGQVYLDPKADLAQEQDGLLPKRWILPEKEVK